MRVFVGVDCGATNLRVGLVDEQGKLLVSSKTASPLKSEPARNANSASHSDARRHAFGKADGGLAGGPENFAKIVKEQIENLKKEIEGVEVVAIGVGTPGPLDLEKGVILPSANLGNKEPIDLVSQFSIEVDCPIYFDRDTNVALLGEAWKGAAEGASNVIMLTLGTGVGGAIMINGEIDRGENGQAGEIGHMIIGFAGPAAISDIPTCGLGHEGCLEALINSAQDTNQLGIYLGYGLANVVDIFNPDKVIIGGGKVNMGNFLPKAVEIMKQVGMKPAVDEVEVLYAKLGDSSGILGAARLAMVSSK